MQLQRKVEAGKAGRGRAGRENAGLGNTERSMDSIALLWQRGLQLEEAGRTADAQENWLALLRLDRRHLGALNRLGALLAASGENELACAVFLEAVAAHPSVPATRILLANLLIKTDDLNAARLHLEQALKLDANFRPAHAGLAFVLNRLGEPELAACHGRVAFHGQYLVGAPFRGEGAGISVLELISTRGGNVRLQNFLSDRIFRRTLVTAEFYDGFAALPPHSLVVNMIGDADIAGAALDGAERLLAQTTAPVINSPQAVRSTGRAEVARRLAGLPGVRTALVACLPRERLAALDAAALLAQCGLLFPLLLRSPGFHGGEHFMRIESAAELPAAVEALPGVELLAIEWLDARGPDGKFRKYRVLTVDGCLYPLHCAVSSCWKVHYFSAEMADVPAHRAEDAAFLVGMAAVLGERAMAALQSIHSALGLDYGGIDFGLGSNGELLLFEANATMVILPPDPDPRWSYRKAAVERVCAAVHAMLLRRARLP